MAGYFRDEDVPWRVQPQFPVRPASWVPPGSAIYVASVGKMVGTDPLSSIGTASGIDNTVFSGGRAIVGNASTSRLPIGNLREASANGFSIISQFVSTTTAVRYLAGNVATGTAYIEDVGVNLDSTESNSANKLFFFLRQVASGFTTRAGSTSAVLTQGKLHTAVWQFRGSGNLQLWVDGVEAALTIATSAYTDTSGAVMEFPVTLLNRNVRNAFSSGGTGLTLGLFARIPSVAFSGAELSRDPWKELFAPQTRRIWVPVSAGGDTTISGALGTATASGHTGTVNANRTIAGALGTASASGFQGTVNANTTISGALGTAVASGLSGTVSNTNDTVIGGTLGIAIASGLIGTVNASTVISGNLGTAVASGLTGTVSNGTTTDLALILKILSNRQELNATTGKFTLYDDDGVTVLYESDAWEDTAGTIPYRGKALRRIDALA